MDKIIIKDLLLRGIIGINDWERKNKQDILINLELDFDIKKAAESDLIGDTLNYRTLTKQIIQLVDQSSFFLVEKLAEEIGRLSIVDFNAKNALVRVEKPMALRFAKSVGVEIRRTPDDY